MFSLILIVGIMRSMEVYRKQEQSAMKALWVGIFSQYIACPLYAFVFTWLFHTSKQETVALYLLVSFPTNRFVLIVPWLSRGCALLSATFAFISILACFIFSPFIFYTLMTSNRLTSGVLISFSYWEFVYSIFPFIASFLAMVVIAILLGIYFWRTYPELYEIVENKVRGIAYLFMVVFMIITFLQSQELFTEHWYFFSWKVLLFNVSFLILVVLLVHLLHLPNFTGRAVWISSAHHFLSPCFILVFLWYPTYLQTQWLFFVQMGIYHFCLVFIAWFLAYKDKKYHSPLY